jgi:hypothetical protein
MLAMPLLSDVPAVLPHALETGDRFQIDKVLVAQHAGLQRQQKFRAARVKRRLIAMAVEKFERLLERWRPVELEPMRQHVRSSPAGPESAARIPRNSPPPAS